MANYQCHFCGKQYNEAQYRQLEVRLKEYIPSCARCRFGDVVKRRKQCTNTYWQALLTSTITARSQDVALT